MIKKNITEENAFVEIYTTLEPCIMCLGTLVMSRVNRIVFACPDPLGGATSINKNTLSEYYVERWPKIKGNVLKNDSLALLLQFMRSKKTDFWKENLKIFEEI